MARLPYANLEELPPLVRENVREFGDLNVDRMLAHAPAVLGPWHETFRAVLAGSVLTSARRELVILRVAHVLNCEYELVQHEVSARAVGLADAEIAAAKSADPAPEVLTAPDRAVLRLVTAMVERRVVPDEVVADVRAELGERGTVELTVLVALYSGLALLLNALEVEVDATARMRFAP